MKTSFFAAGSASLLTVIRCAAVPGDLDPGFDAGATATEIFATIVQPDGKVLLGGEFTAVRGTPCGYFARLNPDGSLESTATFNPGTGANARVNCIVVQNDGKLLLGGDFTSINGQPRTRIARLHPNGEVESLSTFDPGTGANGRVRAIVPQPDGKILLTGEFTSVNGQPLNRIARLNPDGSLESPATFNPGTGANSVIYGAKVLQDGSILIWGGFTGFNGSTRNRIARLHANGSLESTATFNIGTGANDLVWAVSVQPDGRLIVGGLFSTFNGQSRGRIVRLSENGAVESTATFNATASSTVRSIILQTDGRILIGGLFTSVNSQSRNRIARLLPNGALDSLTAFDPGTGANSNVSGIASQPDGKVILGGMFTSVAGTERLYAARLLNDPVSETVLVQDRSRIQWLRSGPAQEIPAADFELSTDGGQTWTALGAGDRITGGWELSGLNLPASGKVRARGRIAGGYHNASWSLAEGTATWSASDLQLWRQTHFGTPDPAGNAANHADPDKDGLENLVEFAFALNPNLADAAALPAWERDDDNYILTFTRPANVSGITYVAEYSDSLTPGNWTAAPNAGNVTNLIFVATATGPRLYLRLRVTSP